MKFVDIMVNVVMIVVMMVLLVVVVVMEWWVVSYLLSFVNLVIVDVDVFFGVGIVGFVVVVDGYCDVYGLVGCGIYDEF